MIPDHVIFNWKRNEEFVLGESEQMIAKCTKQPYNLIRYLKFYIAKKRSNVKHNIWDFFFHLFNCIIMVQWTTNSLIIFEMKSKVKNKTKHKLNKETNIFKGMGINNRDSYFCIILRIIYCWYRCSVFTYGFTSLFACEFSNNCCFGKANGARISVQPNIGIAILSGNVDDWYFNVVWDEETDCGGFSGHKWDVR
jgi:hypothetical protein